VRRVAARTIHPQHHLPAIRIHPPRHSLLPHILRHDSRRPLPVGLISYSTYMRYSVFYAEYGITHHRTTFVRSSEKNISMRQQVSVLLWKFGLVLASACSLVVYVCVFVRTCSRMGCRRCCRLHFCSHCSLQHLVKVLASFFHERDMSHAGSRSSSYCAYERHLSQAPLPDAESYICTRLGSVL
jgi:hypothetical protein